MHLKSCQIDGRVLRTGAANFSASGLKRQDNDLIVIRDVQAAEKFKNTFETRFASGEAISLVGSNWLQAPIPRRAVLCPIGPHVDWLSAAFSAPKMPTKRWNFYKFRPSGNINVGLAAEKTGWSCRSSFLAAFCRSVHCVLELPPLYWFARTGDGTAAPVPAAQRVLGEERLQSGRNLQRGLCGSHTDLWQADRN
jgi:PLD-like domain